MQDKDNRKNERILIQAKATIGSSGLSGEGFLMDFSSQGIGLLIDNSASINIGQKLNVSLETAPKPTTVEGVIKWVRKLNEGRLFDCAVGMELIDFDKTGYINLLKHSES